MGLLRSEMMEVVVGRSYAAALIADGKLEMPAKAAEKK